MCFDKCVVFSSCGHGYFCVQRCPKSVEHCESIDPKEQFVGGCCESCKSERYDDIIKQEMELSMGKMLRGFVTRIARKEKKSNL